MADADSSIHAGALPAGWEDEHGREHEGRVISERTKSALAAAKRRGVKLGTYGRVLATANRKAAEDRAAALAATIGQLRAEGFTTVRDVAGQLNARGIPTARPGGRWHLQTVHNLLRRIDPSGRPRRR